MEKNIRNFRFNFQIFFIAKLDRHLLKNRKTIFFFKFYRDMGNRSGNDTAECLRSRV